nr:hypothetical protein [Gemmatimonadaceae bacterium]
VHHYHRSSDAALRKQIYSYAIGHAAYHWYLIWRYCDQRSLMQLAWHLPVWFARNFRRGLRGRTKYPVNLVPIEVKGTLLGPIQFTVVKVTRWLTRRTVRSTAIVDAPAMKQRVDPRFEEPYANFSRQKRARVA